MIKQITIENFKSIAKLTIELGRVNVLVGDNGCGKTNILEAIALSAAAAQSQLDGPLLALRGVRPSAPRLMRPTFAAPGDDTRLVVQSQDPTEPPFACALYLNTRASAPGWAVREPESPAGLQMNDLERELASLVQRGPGTSSKRGRPKRLRSDPEDLAHYSGLIAQLAALARSAGERAKTGPSSGLPEALAAAAFAAGSTAFAAYGAEITARTPPAELDHYMVFTPNGAAIRDRSDGRHSAPIGASGQGLLEHVSALASLGNGSFAGEILNATRALAGPSQLEIPGDPAAPPESITDPPSVGDAILFVHLYNALLISPEAPAFFAIDNVDTALSPRLCVDLIRRLVVLADKYDKQVIVTAQNPAMLDGLDLRDDDQRILAVSREGGGPTTCRRLKSRPAEGVPLSEAFLRDPAAVLSRAE